MVLKKHLKLQTLKKSLVSIYKQNKERIFDIILFGSITKGKSFVEDVDVCIVFKEEDLVLFDNISKLNKDLHISRLSLDELYSQSLWKTIFREGYSIIHKKRVIDIFGFKSYGLYTYDLTSLRNKSRFSQILKGYKSSSILKKVQGTILKPGVILVPIDFVEEFRPFLETWNVRYTLKYILSE